MLIELHSADVLGIVQSEAWQLARKLRFTAHEALLLATAATALARQLAARSPRSNIILSQIQQDGRLGVQIIAHEQFSGAGEDPALVSGLRWLVDELVITSAPADGDTCWVAKKWRGHVADVVS